MIWSYCFDATTFTVEASAIGRLIFYRMKKPCRQRVKWANILIEEEPVTVLASENSPKSSFSWTENVAFRLMVPLTFRYMP